MTTAKTPPAIAQAASRPRSSRRAWAVGEESRLGSAPSCPRPAPAPRRCRAASRSTRARDKTAAAPSSRRGPPGGSRERPQLLGPAQRGEPAHPVERVARCRRRPGARRPTRGHAAPSSSASRRVEATWLTSAPTPGERDRQRGRRRGRTGRTRPPASSPPPGPSESPSRSPRRPPRPATTRPEGGPAADRPGQDQLLTARVLLGAQGPDGRDQPRGSRRSRGPRRRARRRNRRLSAGPGGRRRRSAPPCCRRSSSRNPSGRERRVGAPYAVPLPVRVDEEEEREAEVADAAARTRAARSR